MTAHLKVDPKTREVLAFRYHVVRPYLTFFRIDANGKKQQDLPIFSMTTTSLIHDLAVTKNYVIFPDTQIVMSGMEITKGWPPVRIDSGKVPRVGIIPRYAKDESELLWIEVMEFNMMHCFNAWEEDDGEKIVMLVSNISCVEHALETIDLARPRLEKVIINVKGKTLERHSLCDEILDMGAINPNYAGKKSRLIGTKFSKHDNKHVTSKQHLQMPH
ncbi:hypothetical protein DH2020_036368 [Rehmannia glutinosa]|uniref:Uncharacterized protein n=1 Tax=Rehmannia glutinosa TaxID=99300 RepID=A0ABR0V749_REHGL